MINVLTYDVKRQFELTITMQFGKWLDEIIEQTGIKKRVIAEKAGIKPGSLSRIISGEHGAAKQTAIDLMSAINNISGREVADINTGLQLVAGVRPDNGLHPQLEEMMKNISYRLKEGFTEADKDALFKEMEFAVDVALQRLESRKSAKSQTEG